MSSKTTHYCDKCGCEVPISKKIFGITLRSAYYTVNWEERIDEYRFLKTFDLCGDCTNKLEKWIREV